MSGFFVPERKLVMIADIFVIKVIEILMEWILYKGLRDLFVICTIYYML